MRDTGNSNCGREPDPKDTPLAKLDLAPGELTSLTIARYYFQSFCAPQTMSWINAMAEAETHFGMEHGPRVAARILAALQAIRQARRSTFMFNSPSCPGCAAIATEHERRFLLALAGLRKGDVGKARLEVMMLCEGNCVDYVLSALNGVRRVLVLEPQPCQAYDRPEWVPTNT